MSHGKTHFLSLKTNQRKTLNPEPHEIVFFLLESFWTTTKGSKYKTNHKIKLEISDRYKIFSGEWMCESDVCILIRESRSRTWTELVRRGCWQMRRETVQEPLVDDEGGLRPAGRLNKGTVSFYNGTRRENYRGIPYEYICIICVCITRVYDMYSLC